MPRKTADREIAAQAAPKRRRVAGEEKKAEAEEAKEPDYLIRHRKAKERYEKKEREAKERAAAEKKKAKAAEAAARETVDADELRRLEMEQREAKERAAAEKKKAAKLAPPPPLPVMTAKKIAEEQAERARNVLDLLHPSTSAAGPSALDAATTETVKTIAEHSGLGAEAIAAMLKLDVAAVRAALES